MGGFVSRLCLLLRLSLTKIHVKSMYNNYGLLSTTRHMTNACNLHMTIFTTIYLHLLTQLISGNGGRYNFNSECHCDCRYKVFGQKKVGYHSYARLCYILYCS